MYSILLELLETLHIEGIKHLYVFPVSERSGGQQRGKRCIHRSRITPQLSNTKEYQEKHLCTPIRTGSVYGVRFSIRPSETLTALRSPLAPAPPILVKKIYGGACTAADQDGSR